MIKQVNITVHLDLTKNLDRNSHDQTIEKTIKRIQKIEQELKPGKGIEVRTLVDLNIMID